MRSKSTVAVFGLLLIVGFGSGMAKGPHGVT